MITPDFIGQRYKDTNTGNIWIANSTTPGDWTLELQNMQIEWEPKTLKLAEIFGYFNFGTVTGTQTIHFLGTTSIAGFDLDDLDDLVELKFSNLISIDPLNTQGGWIRIYHCQSLSVLDVSNLTIVGADFMIQSNDSLLSLDASSLVSVGANIYIHDNTSLNSIDISSLSAVGNNVRCSNCALSAATVEHILHVLVGIVGYQGHTIRLEGGTNAGLASLSAQGQADYATLVARPNTVNINA